MILNLVAKMDNLEMFFSKSIWSIIPCLSITFTIPLILRDIIATL